MAHYDPADYWDEEDDDSPYSYRAYKKVELLVLLEFVLLILKRFTQKMSLVMKSLLDVVDRLLTKTNLYRS